MIGGILKKLENFACKTSVRVSYFVKLQVGGLQYFSKKGSGTRVFL